MTPAGRSIARLGVVLAAFALPALVWPLVAYGDAATTAPHVVRVVIAGSDKDANALTGSLAELLSRIGARLDIARVERVDIFDGALSVKTPGTFATAWVDLADPQRATVVLVEGSSGRIVSRRSVARSVKSDIATEELAHIIQASVEDLVAEAPPPPPPAASSSAPPPASASVSAPAPSATPSVSASAAPSTAAPPPVPSTSVVVTRPERDAANGEAASRYAVDVGAFFVGRGFGGDSSVVIGGGGIGSVRFGRGALHPGLSLSGAYHVPFEGSGSLVKVRASALSLRLAGGAEYDVTPRFVVSLGPSVGTDVFFVTPQALSVGNDQVGKGTTDVSPLLGGVLGARYAVTRGAEMFVLFGVDVDLKPHRYVVHDGADVSDVAFLPSRVRPSLSLGFDFTVAGRSSGEEPVR